ncbi:MAG: hypothetical protein ACRDT9_10295 [Agromyces sp.]
MTSTSVKDLLSVAYDAATLAMLDPRAEGVHSSAENYELLERISRTAESHGVYVLVDAIDRERWSDLNELFGRVANAADDPEGAGWEAVVHWVVDTVRPATAGLEVTG